MKPGQALLGQKGFTLIELLVTVAILGLLAGILLPTLARAKDKARSIQCLSAMKQWGVAFKMYAEDNEGWIARECYEPYGEVTLNNWSQAKGRTLPSGINDSADVWYNALPPYLDQRPTSAYASPPERKNFYEKNNLIHCPAAVFPAQASRTTYQFPLFSIAMNSQLIQVGPSIKLSLIENKDPTRTVLFLDNLLENEPKVDPAQENTHLGQPSAYACRFSPRHSKGGNLVFGDGHASWFHGKQVVETGENSPLKGGPILPPRDIIWEVYPF